MTLSRLLKKGTGSELARENPAKNGGREVPVPLFQLSKINAVCTALALILALLGGCNPPPQKAAPTAPPSAAKKKEYAFALIAKNQGNPVFQAARVGAEDAARELGQKLGLSIKTLWRTPNEEDAQKQAESIEQLVAQGVDGLAVSCTVAETVTPAINAAVDQGVAVICFDSDAPASKRFCFYGTDDFGSGRTIMRELAAVLGPGKHIVAVPGGNQNAANIQNRVRGALEEAKQHPNITIKGVFYSKETPQDAAAKIEEVQTANPDIDGWAMIGSWSLFTDALMKWEPGKVKIVAMDALPAELPYLEKGIVAKLYAQQTYQWGYRAMELLVAKVILGQPPKEVIEYSPLLPVTRDQAKAFGEKWKKWLRQ
jgi:ribose transport system substrate-binding protein